MNRTTRLIVFAVSGAAMAVAFVIAFTGLPHFGSARHPYRAPAVHDAVADKTANVVSSVNFDLRGLDTLGEETILLASVIGVSALLRRGSDEKVEDEDTGGRLHDSTRLFGYFFVPVTVVVGFTTVLHGHLTPGGGFQGGVVLATGVHLLYVAGSFRALDRVRPVPVVEVSEAIGAGAFASFGIAAGLASAGFLGNVLPKGAFGDLFSSGSVLLLSVAVGVEVASGVIVLLAKFLEQSVLVESDSS